MCRISYFYMKLNNYSGITRVDFNFQINTGNIIYKMRDREHDVVLFNCKMKPEKMCKQA